MKCLVYRMYMKQYKYLSKSHTAAHFMQNCQNIICNSVFASKNNRAKSYSSCPAAQVVYIQNYNFRLSALERPVTKIEPRLYVSTFHPSRVSKPKTAGYNRDCP